MDVHSLSKRLSLTLPELAILLDASEKELEAPQGNAQLMLMLNVCELPGVLEKHAIIAASKKSRSPAETRVVAGLILKLLRNDDSAMLKALHTLVDVNGVSLRSLGIRVTVENA